MSREGPSEREAAWKIQENLKEEAKKIADENRKIAEQRRRDEQNKKK